MVANRINWIDWAKVIAITFVVFGHTPQDRGDFLIGYICSFHMPLFFVLCGFLAKGSTDTMANIKKHWHSLILPYLLYNALFYPYWLVRFLVDDQGETTMLEMLVKPLFGALLLQIETPVSVMLNGVTWFLAVLLVMRIILNVCHRSRHVNVLLVVTALLMMVLNVISDQYQLVDSFFGKGLLRCYPFFVFGHLLKKESLLDRCQIGSYSMSAIFYFILSIGIHVFRDSWMEYDVFISIPLSYLFMVTACLAIIYTCLVLNMHSSCVLVALSSGTLAIMGLHWMFIGTINFVVERMLGIHDITYSWYVAILLSVAICFMIFPFIVFSIKYAPCLLGKTRIMQKTK